MPDNGRCLMAAEDGGECIENDNLWEMRINGIGKNRGQHGKVSGYIM